MKMQIGLVNVSLGSGTKASKKLDTLKEKVTQAETALEILHVQWRDQQEYYNGPGQETKYRPILKEYGLDDELVITNFTQASIEQFISVLLQATPSWYAVGPDGEHDDIAKRISQFLQAFYHDRNVALELEMAYRHTGIVGGGWLKAGYNRLIDDVDIRCIDPLMVFPDPTANRLQDAEYVGIKHIYGKAMAKRLFEKLKIDEAETAGSVETRGREQNEAGGATRIVIWEVYHEFGEQLTIYSGNQELYKGENPMPNNRFPLFHFPMQVDTDTLWGVAMVEQLMPLQDLINKSRTRIAIHLRFSANPMMHVNRPLEDIKIEPGGLIKTGEGGSANWIIPPVLPKEVFALVDGAKSDMDTISGVREILRGVAPKRTTSGISLEILQQAAQTRITAPLRNWTFTLADLGQTVLELMQQHYSSDRWLPLAQAQAPGTAQLGVNDLSEIEFSDELGEDGQQKTNVVNREWRVVMQPQGNLPLSPAADLEMAFRLREMQDIDQIAMLEAARFSGREGVLERKKKEMAAAQKGQAAAEQMLEEQAGQVVPEGGLT